MAADIQIASSVKTWEAVGDIVGVDVFDVDKSEGGVLLPDKAKRFQTATGRVVTVGPLCKQVKEGDIVLFADGTPCLLVNHRGVKLHVLHEEALVGIELPPPSAN